MNNLINVTCVINTKNRYYTTLPLSIISISNQTYLPKELIIYDDNEYSTDLRNIPLFQHLFLLLSQKGIQWRVLFSKGVGQVKNHKNSIKDAKYPLIWRIDDDEYAESNVLEELVININKDVGAIGGLILNPQSNYKQIPSIASSKIEDIYLNLNVQLFQHKDNSIKEVDHLHSSFLYWKKLAEYPTDLSLIGHREETILTYSIKRGGYKLLVNPNIITWHFRFPIGGIRDNKKEDFEYDDKIFKEKLIEWSIVPNDYKIFILDNGLGDHLVFKKILLEVRNKYKNIILACCYPNVFEDIGEVKIISISEAKSIINIDNYNVYKWMREKNWERTTEEAYRELYSI